MNLYDEISRVAYDIWIRKGMPQGNDMENWLEAEQIVYSTLREGNDQAVEIEEISVTTIAPVKAETNEVKDVAQPAPKKRGRKPASTVSVEQPEEKATAKRKTTRKTTPKKVAVGRPKGRKKKE